MTTRQWPGAGLPMLLVCAAPQLGGCASQESRAPAPTAAPVAPPQIQKARTTVARLRKLASVGDLDSQVQLGSLYFAGQPEKHLKQAEHWWKQAADKGHATAAVSLAYRYTGRGNPDFTNQRDMLKYLNQSAPAAMPWPSTYSAPSTSRASQACHAIPTRPKSCSTAPASRITPPVVRPRPPCPE